VKDITVDKKTTMKKLIDKVRKKVGRDPVREPSHKFPKYWIITPPGSLVDVHGNPSKIRHVQEGNLNKSQVKLLEKIGYAILKYTSINYRDLKVMFTNLERWP